MRVISGASPSLEPFHFARHSKCPWLDASSRKGDLLAVHKPSMRAQPDDQQYDNRNQRNYADEEDWIHDSVPLLLGSLMFQPTAGFELLGVGMLSER